MEWERRLQETVHKQDSWVDALRESIERESWMNLAEEAGSQVNLLRSLHSLVKRNDGRFKSDSQAQFLQEAFSNRAPAANPIRWYSGYDSSRHAAVAIPQRVGAFRKQEPGDVRYCAFGFILDEHGVVARVKFGVKYNLERPGYGKIDDDVLTSNFLRED